MRVDIICLHRVRLIEAVATRWGQWQSCRLDCNATGSKQTHPSIQQFVTHSTTAAADANGIHTVYSQTFSLDASFVSLYRIAFSSTPYPHWKLSYFLLLLCRPQFFVGLHPSPCKILLLFELANFSEGELLAQQHLRGGV